MIASTRAITGAGASFGGWVWPVVPPWPGSCDPQRGCHAQGGRTVRGRALANLLNGLDVLEDGEQGVGCTTLRPHASVYRGPAAG